MRFFAALFGVMWDVVCLLFYLYILQILPHPF